MLVSIIALKSENNLSFIKIGESMGEPRVCSAVSCILVQSSRVNKNPNFLTRLVAKTSPNSHANCTKEFDPPKTDKYYRELSTMKINSK